MDGLDLPELTADVKLTDNCLTITSGSEVGEFFLDDNDKLNIWQLDEFISKLIAKEADRQHLRNRLSGN